MKIRFHLFIGCAEFLGLEVAIFGAVEPVILVPHQIGSQNVTGRSKGPVLSIDS